MAVCNQWSCGVMEADAGRVGEKATVAEVFVVGVGGRRVKNGSVT